MNFSYVPLPVGPLRPVPTDVAAQADFQALSTSFTQFVTSEAAANAGLQAAIDAADARITSTVQTIGDQIVDVVGAEQLVNQALQTAIDTNLSDLLGAQSDLYNELNGKYEELQEEVVKAQESIDNLGLADANFQTEIQATFDDVQAAIQNLRDFAEQVVIAHV